MVDLSNAVAGGVTGAGTGGLFGGVPGAVAGGVLGFGAGALGFGKGKKPKLKNQPNYTPEQLEMINQITELAKQGNQGALEWLNSLYDDEEGAFADYERPFMEQFQQEIIPRIMERFRGGGSKNSSGLQQSLGQAATRLSSDLAAGRNNMRMQGASALQGYTNIGLNKLNTPYQTSGTPSIWSQVAPAAGEVAAYGGKKLLDQRFATGGA